MRRNERSGCLRECQLLGHRTALGSLRSAFGGKDINSISPRSPHVLSAPASHCEREIGKTTQANPTLLPVRLRVSEDPRPIDRPVSTASALQEQPTAVRMRALTCRPAASISEPRLCHVRPCEFGLSSLVQPTNQPTERLWIVLDADGLVKTLTRINNK